MVMVIHQALLFVFNTILSDSIQEIEHKKFYVLNFDRTRSGTYPHSNDDQPLNEYVSSLFPFTVCALYEISI